MVVAPMTEAQREQLRLLSLRAGLPFDAGLNQDQAAQRIDELRRGGGATEDVDADSAAGEEDPGAALGELDAPRS